MVSSPFRKQEMIRLVFFNSEEGFSSSGDYQLISRRDGSGSVSKPIYRKKELKRIVSTLQANSSLLVVGEAGCGKTFLANAVEERLADLGFIVGRMKAGT